MDNKTDLRVHAKTIRKGLDITSISANIVNLIKGYKIVIEFNYDNIKQINYLLKDIQIKKEYGNTITYTFNIKEDSLNKIENELSKISKIKLKKEITLAS